MTSQAGPYHSLIVFTDGACSGNPGPGGWAAILLSPDGRVKELGGGESRTTNNRMELAAVIESLRLARGTHHPVRIYTDSTYVISGITNWIAGWRRRNWSTAEGKPVLNRDLWEELDSLAASFKGAGLSWHYVRGHTGSPGNERCDEIAVSFSKGRPERLYDGPLSGYSRDLLDLPKDVPPPKAAAPGRMVMGQAPRKRLPYSAAPGRMVMGQAPRKRLPYSAAPGRSQEKKGGYYLSLLGGKLERHAVWAECQARVHGKNAKFKKVSSKEEEEAVLRSWGV